MKKIILVISSVLAVLFLASCNREPDPVLTIDGPKTYTCSTSGMSSPINFYTTYPWTITCEASWISISSRNGEAGDNQIEFSVSENLEPEARESLIYFSTQTLRDTIKVTQSQKDMITVNGSKSYTFDAKGGSLSIEIKANIDFGVKIEADWIKRTELKSYDARTISFDILPNTDYDGREAMIIFRNNAITDSIKVYQKQLNALIPSSEDNIMLSRSSQNFKIDVSTNIEYGISVSADTWLKYVETKALHNESLLFSVTENNSGNSRTASITLSGPDGIKQVYSVTQSASNMLMIGINSKSFFSPTIKGNQVKGTIDWGDGISERYVSGILHNYSAQDSHNINIEVSGNTEVKLESLVGVESIDLSTF